MQVQVLYPLSLRTSEQKENRYHFHVVPPKLEIDISLRSLRNEYVEHHEVSSPSRFFFGD